MRYLQSIQSSLVFLLSLSGFCLAKQECALVQLEADPSHLQTCQGIEAIRTNKPDSAREFFLGAFRQGLSRDSLYYYLSEVAFSTFAFDTAMAFNLSINTPKEEPFRQAVLDQRYRLYIQVGIPLAAKAILDSMSIKPSHSKPPKELHLRLGTGYFRESNYSAKDYPFGFDLGGFLSEGWQFRNQAELIWPLSSFAGESWCLGFNADGIKSFAKDSLDYRGGALLRVKGFFSDSLTFSLSGQVGKVSGFGYVSTYKLESAYLAFTSNGLTLVQGGYESERDETWRHRFDGFWFSFYHDHSPRHGYGFNFGLTTSLIRVDVTEEEKSIHVIYIDDVTKAKPTHYQNENFRDTLPGSGISTFLRYSTATGTFTSRNRSPQGLAMILPSLGYAFVLPWKFSVDVGITYTSIFYTEPYTWQEAETPPPFSNTAASGFRGLALSRADGKLYSALLLQESGGFQEYYGATSLQEKSIYRLDQQWGTRISMRRHWGPLGTFALEGQFKKNESNIADRASYWIPKWEIGANLKWNRSWQW